ncbi:unnamed protein product [Mytilus coruscus]|uniref:C2H2-type domain-containing protein n=1 Tax=Mytilus coruscus TaxID=42192 RepID=A0A6J8EP18_MYTCO|nr:unnamed protein product [Mytilus coruscus]
MKEQTKNGNEVVDCIDRRVEKDIQDELMITCTACGRLNRKRKLICEGCNEREEAKNTAIKVEHDEDNVYDHVPTNHKASHQITITDPVFCNPNSYDTVAMVLRKIGKDIGIYKYGGQLRHWTFICCDGLPYVICKKLQEEAVICTENNCHEKFLSKDKFMVHARVVHKDQEYCQFVKEFDWFYLRIGAGHYEMNLIKSFFELNWVPYLETLCERMGFISEAAKQYAKACKDLHKSWNLLLIFHIASLRELVLPYVRHCILSGKVPDAKHFLEYSNNVYQSTQRPNFKYMMDTVCRFSQGIINFRMAIRRNNSDLLKSAKYMTKELFHGRQHPKYQQIEVNDTIQDMLMPENVQIINDAYSSITTSENKSTGQDFDFVLEEKNRQLKSWIPKGMPTDTIWQTVCRNNLILEKIKENSMFMFGIHSDKGVSKPLDIDDAVYSFRCNLRSTDYLNKSVDHTSVSNVALDEQLVHFIEKATSKRMAYIRTSILNKEIESTVFLRSPLPVTPYEREKIYSLENMTVARIKLEIERMLNLIPDGIQYEYHQQLFTNTTNRTKGNSEGGEVEDDVNSVDTGSENDNEHDEVDVQNDVDIDVVLDHDDSDKSEKNKPNHAKPKPGKFKAGKLSAAQILNNKVQAKRMAKSRIMNKLKKLKNKLLTEQPYEPVEVLYVVYERTTKKFKYDGSGFLVNRFENCRPLSSGIPRKKVTERKGGCQQLHINKDKGVQFLTPKKYMYPFAPSAGKSLAEKQKAEIDGLNIQVEDSEVIISKKTSTTKSTNTKRTKKKKHTTKSTNSKEPKKKPVKRTLALPDESVPVIRIDAKARKRKSRGKKALPRKRNTQKRKRAETESDTESDTEVSSVNDDEVISDSNISDSNEDMEDLSENNVAVLPMLNDTSFSEKMSEVTESLDLHLEANGLSFIDLVNITMNSEIEADIHAPCTDDKPTSRKKRVTPQACQVIEADIHAPCTDDKPTSSKKRVTPQACQVIEADIHAPCTDDKPTSSKKRVTPQACQVIEADTEKDSPKIVQVNVGDHVAIRHGKIIFPAMINRIDDHDDSVYWIQFFKEISNNKWSLEHKEFSAIHTDFLKILAPPDLVFESCSRFNYKFQDL